MWTRGVDIFTPKHIKAKIGIQVKNENENIANQGKNHTVLSVTFKPQYERPLDLPLLYLVLNKWGKVNQINKRARRKRKPRNWMTVSMLAYSLQKTFSSNAHT